MKTVLQLAIALFIGLVVLWTVTQVAKGAARAAPKSFSALQGLGVQASQSGARLAMDPVQAQHAAAAASCAAVRAEYLEGYAFLQRETHSTIKPEDISTSVDLWAIAKHLNITPAAEPARALEALQRLKVSKASSKKHQKKMQPGEAAVLSAVRLRELSTADPGIEAAVAMMLAGTLDGAVRCLTGNDTVLQSHAVEVVSVLSGINGTARVAIAAVPGCIEGLGQLLSSSDLTLQGKAAEALENLASCRHNCCLAVGASPGVIQTLVSLLHSNESLTQGSAAAALRHLAVNPVYAKLIARVPGTVGRLMEMLEGNISDALKVQAAWGLANLAAHQQVTVCMQRTGVFSKMLLLQHSDNAELARAASVALGHCQSDFTSVLDFHLSLSADTGMKMMGPVSTGSVRIVLYAVVTTVGALVLTVVINMAMKARHGDPPYHVHKG